MALTAPIGGSQGAKFGDIRGYTMGNQQIWNGALVVVRLVDGLAYPAVEDIGDELKQVVIGWALESKAPSSPPGIVRVRADGQYKLKFPGVDSTAIGKLALVFDDETVQLYDADHGATVVGRITAIATIGLEVFVDLRNSPSRLADGIYD